MNNSNSTVILFDSSFDNYYVSTWMKAIKTKKIKHFYAYVAKDNTLRFMIDGEKDNANIANLDLLIHLYFDYREFADIPVDLNALIQFLSSEEKSEYIKKQDVLIEEDCWLFYDVRKIMIRWIKDTYPNKFDAYVKSVIEKRLSSFRDSHIYKDTIKRLEKIAKQNYIEAHQEEKKRDILAEIEKEHDDLTDKIIKLEKFINASDVYKTLPDIEKKAMKKQLSAMKEYANQLFIRINSLRMRGE